MSDAESKYFDARDDAIAQDQADREAAYLPTDYGDGASPVFKAGDVVHIGDGETRWQVRSLWQHGLTWYADLTSSDRQSQRTSATVARLRRAS